MICRTAGDKLPVFQINAMKQCPFIPRYLRGIFLSSIFCLFPLFLHSQVSLGAAFNPAAETRYSIVEKENMRQRINGAYKGFVHNEVRGTLVRESDQSAEYSGNFYVLQSMTRDLRHVARQIDDIVPVKLSFSATGEMRVSPDTAYPLLRDFPRFPTDIVMRGDRWQSAGVRVVDPLRRGATRIPFLCEYEYMGLGDYNGNDAHIVRAQYALRYRRGTDPYGDRELSSLQGRHVVDIYYPVDQGFTLFMRDVVEEIYQYADGSTVHREGFILTWLEDFPSMNREALKDDLGRLVQEEQLENVSVDERDEGIYITLKNLQFYPDSPQLLPGEMTKLKSIAKALKRISGRSFLVTGHTADVGSMESQYDLSVQRAKVITDLLTKEGIEAERFLFRGVGGTDPLGPNHTEEGRAMNRRVEIMILED